MEKRNMTLKNNFFLIIFLVSIVGCKNKETEFIEITEGRSMNPSEPRIGIKITSSNNSYLCTEIILDGRRTEKYKYFKNTKPVNFNELKKQVLENFDTNIKPDYIKANDATYYQLTYHLSSKKYKSKFIESDLTYLQSQLLLKIMNLSKLKNYKEIGTHDFSKELLEEKLPAPPSL
ncbi:hypothetical protein [Chryseobacterium sp. 2R14A]|uniref:hypothetical protein n=1 Tax=Chryseobacterium sp. 2R14A TaxID=3380353 RepID=UPI003CF29EB6